MLGKVTGRVRVNSNNETGQYLMGMMNSVNAKWLLTDKFVGRCEHL